MVQASSSAVFSFGCDPKISGHSALYRGDGQTLLVFKRGSHLSVSTVGFLPKGFGHLSHVSVVNVYVTDKGNV